MHWNYRVIRSDYMEMGETETSYAIHEAYYDKRADDLPNGITENPVTIHSETPEGILKILDWMRLAVLKPVLKLDGDKVILDPQHSLAKGAHMSEEDAAAVTLQELANETLVQKHTRLMQAKCEHEEIYSSTFIGPNSMFTNSFCLDCGKSWTRRPVESS